MNNLLLKVLVTPALIGTASLAGRRWGHSISGWLVALPLTTGPITLFLALSHGPAFAASSAAGTLAGGISQAAFVAAYSQLAPHWKWPATLAAAILSFAACTALLQQVTFPSVPLCAVVFLVFTLVLRVLPRNPDARQIQESLPPRWDIPLRMIIATAFVLLITGLAPAFGARLTGLLAPFPLFTATLAAFAHQQAGPAAAINVLRGLLMGLFSYASFFFALAILLIPAGIGLAFAVATVAMLALQGISLWLLQRRPDASQSSTRSQAELYGIGDFMHLALTARRPFNFHSVVMSHGWVQLAPFRFDESASVLCYVDRLANGRIVEYRVSPAPTGVNVEAAGRFGKAEQNEAARKVEWMLGLDQDFSLFYKVARLEPKLRHVRKLARGRVLRSPTFFEDILKTIFTTNTLWAATKRINLNLIAAYGEPLAGSDSLRAFPTPQRIAQATPEELRQTVRAGYRAPAIHELASRVASGELDIEAFKARAAHARAAQGAAQDPGHRSVCRREPADDPRPLGLHPHRHVCPEDGFP